MNKEKLTVYQIDFKYRKYLRKICIEALSFYRGIPLSWEDIYNNFLFEAQKILEEYEDDNELSIKTFLGIKCKFFARNYCKSFQTNKHKIMNESISIEGDRNISLRDTANPPVTIDISMFTPNELVVYQSHYLDGKPFKQIQEENGMTRYKVRSLIKDIQLKMFLSLKN